MLRSRIRRRLRDSIGVPLKEELHLYGIALSHWGEQVVRKLELLLNSYADAYRVQLHRARGSRLTLQIRTKCRQTSSCSTIGNQTSPLI
jgi:hypothetical protein